MSDDSTREEDIKNHRKVKITEIDVLRRLNMTEEECSRESTMRRFCAGNGKILPGEIEIVTTRRADTDSYEWHVDVYEQPNLPEPAAP